MIQKINNNLYLYRDDLFSPFDFSEANGTKLRQCINLVEYIKPKGLITYCSIDSPQQLIVATVAKDKSIPCKIILGGERESLYTVRAKELGAEIIRHKPSGRHSVLKSVARKQNENLNYFIVDYGINISHYPEIFISSTSKMVENIPDEIEEVFITCGSGFSSVGLIIGKNIYKKQFNINLISNAPSRISNINNILKTLNMPELQNSYQYIDAYKNTNFNYTKKIECKIEDIILHPLYEAKAWKYVTENNIVSHNKKNLFFIIGKEI